MIFSPVLWKNDTLGIHGTKLKAIHKTNVLSRVRDKTPREVEDLWGEPGFYCMHKDKRDPSYTSYLYHYGYFRLAPPPEYRYKPRQKCRCYVTLGSRLIISFDKKSRRAYDLEYLIVD
jgi:hypothetical protein